MIRPSSRSSLSQAGRRPRRVIEWSVAVVVAACGSRARGPSFATTTDVPDAPRRPDGVVVDPSPELPPSLDVAEPSSSLVALKPPLPVKAARSAVAAFFRAVVAEDTEGLSDLLTPDANAPNKSRGVAPGLLDVWRGRLRHFRYRALAGEALYQESDIEFYRYDDLETLVPGRPLRPVEMTRADLLLRVPMLVVRAGSDRVFGDDILFLLRRDRDRFRIRQLVEDFQLP